MANHYRFIQVDRAANLPEPYICDNGGFGQLKKRKTGTSVTSWLRQSNFVQTERDGPSISLEGWELLLQHVYAPGRLPGIRSGQGISR